MKLIRNSLGRNPLSDALHRNLGVVLNGQGPGRHNLRGASICGALHLRSGVVKNEQGSSHFSRRVRRVRKLAEPTRIRLDSWNVGSLTGKLRELVDVAIRRRVNILCVQETKWKGQKAKEVEGSGFKLWYTGTTSGRNGVGILIDKSLKDGVVDVRRQGDRIILVRLVIGDLVLNVISAYASQVGLSESSKSQFWEDLDSMVSTVPISEKLFERGGGEDVLNFAVAYDLLLANTLFRKRESHLVTFHSGQYSSQIDFILARREDRRACLDCKVISGECVVPQHKLVVADFRFRVASEVFGVSRGGKQEVKETWWWNDEVQRAIKEKKDA
ncbi:hypothetical protein PAHAL_3G038200 [Panicum hallii]|uniref:Endonuclease/exonuclease/phosphatase domain-containing protein n=1 Tax=Panicum hallii TaxID=206008 RepID=A0A2T8KH55_9POAL|nr:hypothetical protein PAHAL_3G038200 [Panicum hallii]